MSDPTCQSFAFPSVRGKKLTAAFDGGRLSSDGGVLLLAQAARRLGIAEKLAAVIPDRRDPSRIVHPLPEILLARILAIACGYEGVQRAFETGIDFDAIFAHNDLSATGAMQAVLDSGRRIPQDVAVVGFDDIPMAAHTQPPLTTVHQPLREMGEAAARMLLAHFEGTPLPNRPTVIPATFTARASTTGHLTGS